jgi:hypothetical protein
MGTQYEGGSNYLLVEIFTSLTHMFETFDSHPLFLKILKILSCMGMSNNAIQFPRLTNKVVGFESW